MKHEARALAQEAHAAKANRVDVDHSTIAASLEHHVMIAHHLVRIGMGDAEGIHDLLAGLLFVIENTRHDRGDALFKRRVGWAHQFFIVLDEIDA